MTEKQTKWRGGGGGAAAATRESMVGGAAPPPPPHKKLTEPFQIIAPPPVPAPVRFFVSSAPPAAAAREGFSSPPPPPPEGGACAMKNDVITDDFGKKPPGKGDLDKLKKYLAIPITMMVKFDPMFIVYNNYTNAFLVYISQAPIMDMMTDASLNSTVSLGDLWKNVEFGFGYGASNLEKRQEDDYQKQLQDQQCRAANEVENAKSGATVAPARPPPLPRPLRAANPTLTKDIETVKKYLSRTIVFALSYFTVYNWAYLLFIYANDVQPTEAPPPPTPDNAGLFGLGLLFHKIGEIFTTFNPFYIASRFFTYLHWGLFEQFGKKNSNEYFDKKIWFVFLFFMTILAGQIFLVNFSKYTYDISKRKMNPMLIFLMIICVGLFIQSFIIDFTIWVKLDLGFGGTVRMLVYLFKNLFLIFMLFLNPFIVLFFLLFYFMYYSFFATLLYPTFNPSIGERIQLLKTTIEQDYQSKAAAAAAEDGTIMKIFKNFIYLLYNHPIMLMILWFIIMWIKLIDKQELKYGALRENVSLMLIVVITLLITIKTIMSFMGGGGGGGEAPAAAADAAPE